MIRSSSSRRLIRVRDAILELLKPLHRRMRNQKIAIFLQLARERDTTLLDLGGGPGISGESHAVHQFFGSVVVVNRSRPMTEGSSFSSLPFVMADGCSLPFSSRSFDWVFSNAVIEHVGGWARQRRFADEIRRVAAKGYFVATPNRFFPIEPHTLLPFYQFMDPKRQAQLVRFSPGYMREPLEIHLLSPRDLQCLFPEAHVLKMGFPVFPNNLVAMYRADRN